MKNKFGITILMLSLMIACNDEKYLDSFPRDSMTTVSFWNSEGDALGALLDCYRNGFIVDQTFREARSDNSVQWYDWMDEGTRIIADGTVTKFDDVVSTTWSDYFTGIRKCNFFLENVDKVPFKNTTHMDRMKAEARFIRAYVYLYAAFDFGAIPLVQKTLTVNEAKQVEQKSQEAIYTFVLSEFEECAKILEANYDSEPGRITKGACYAAKARTYLFKNDYPNVLSEIAKLEALGRYSLNTAGDTPFDDLFWGPNQRQAEATESILTILCAPQTGKIAAGNSANGACLLKGLGEEDPYTTMWPLGSLVDAFPMADGRLIDEAGSTFDPSNPYVNRDPRRASTIICPGDNMGHLVGDNIVWDLPYEPENPNTFWSFRIDYPYTSTTALVWKKGVDWTPWGLRNVWNSSNDVNLIRWADVLLMKAEALVETIGTGSKGQVCDIIDQLRDRCKGGRVHRENYSTKEALVKLVRTERRVELANEGLRYYDLIRWKIAEKNPVTEGEGLNGDAYGAFMKRDGLGKDDKFITIDGVPRRFVEIRKFDPSKNYLLPIPQREIDFNPKLKQNPGWN